VDHVRAAPQVPYRVAPDVQGHIRSFSAVRLLCRLAMRSFLQFRMRACQDLPRFLDRLLFQMLLSTPLRIALRLLILCRYLMVIRQLCLL
jgi:hypothetical protein